MARPAEEPRDPLLARYVFERLAARPETALAISKRTGVSRATLSYILTGKGSYGVARRICTKLLPVLGHRNYEELLAAAYARGASPAPVYPTLISLLERHRARWSEAAVSAVAQLRPPTDPGVEYWQRALDAIDGTVRLVEATVPPAPASSPLVDIEKRSKKK